jgi:hypothetical protein
MDPKEYVLENGRDFMLRDKVEALYKQSTGHKIEYKNNFRLERGPYEIISVMDESVGSEPYAIKGKLIDLFDPALPVLEQKQVKPGEQACLFNIGRVSNPQTPQVLASAARVYNEKIGDRSYSFIAKSPAKTTGVMRILLPSEPRKITLTDANDKAVTELKSSWDPLGKTSFLSFENNPDGVKVTFEW